MPPPSTETSPAADSSPSRESGVITTIKDPQSVPMHIPVVDLGKLDGDCAAACRESGIFHVVNHVLKLFGLPEDGGGAAATKAFAAAWPEPVVRVQAVAECGLDAIPACYVKPPCDRPAVQLAADVHEPPDISIPVIDLGELLEDGGGAAATDEGRLNKLTEAVAAACREWGFFQVVNHGVPPELMRAALEAARGFFRLRIPLKQQYANLPRTYEGYGSRVGVQMGAVLDWGDYYFPAKSLAKFWPTNPRICKVNEGTPFNSSGHSEEWTDSNLYALVIPQPVAPGLGGSSSTGTMLPCLYLDSGATIHVVGDDKILTNLHDPPSGMVITVADGTRLAINKVGDIQMPDITIRDVSYVPGLKCNLISIRQLAKSKKIVSIFYENHAELWLGGARIGGGIFDTEGLYKLQYLHERS